MKSSSLTVTDQFCGAGGSSLAASSTGATVVVALNHWHLAVDSHQRNFPHITHDCTDISACDPRRYPSTNILVTSPECTNHTRAKGKKRQIAKQEYGSWDLPVIDPAAERSRATMFDVPRFAEVHNYEIIIVENVVEVTDWILFDDWLSMMLKLGYQHKVVCFNSMFAPPDPFPVPQSRDRVYIVFWKKGNPAPNLEFTPPAYCEKCDRQVEAVQVWKRPHIKYGCYGKMGQYIYCCPHCKTREVNPFFYPAASVIDWLHPIERIGDRKRPLEPKTITRVELGLKKFASSPYMVDLGFYSEDRVRNIFTSPGFTQTTAQTIGLTLPPFMIQQNGQEMVPAILNLTGQEPRIQPVTKALATIVAGGGHQGVLMAPFTVNYNGTGTAHPITEALGSVTTRDRHAIVIPSTPVPSVEDCYFRMLKIPEIAAAMAFPHPNQYIILGTVKEQTKMYGNAVTPPVMKMILERCIHTLW